MENDNRSDAWAKRSRIPTVHQGNDHKWVRHNLRTVEQLAPTMLVLLEVHHGNKEQHYEYQGAPDNQV